jgi:hypothetical protein
MAVLGSRDAPSLGVMTGLGPVTHDLLPSIPESKAWIRGPTPAYDDWGGLVHRFLESEHLKGIQGKRGMRYKRSVIC